MIIEQTNATTNKNHRPLFLILNIIGLVLVVPAIIIAIGFFNPQTESQTIFPSIDRFTTTPTPTITETPTPTPLPTTITPTPTISLKGQVIFVSGENETIVYNQYVTPQSQIKLISNDNIIYSIVSKDTGSFTVLSRKTTNQKRTVDYQITNP